MKVTTDACLFGAWATDRIKNEKLIINNCLDIGTGSGLLALILAQKGEFSIDAIEIDKDAFEQAAENMAASPWADRIKIFRGDAREFNFPIQYDIIISNPPFYEKELMSDDAKKNLALHNEGLLLNELLDIIKKNLGPEGLFYLLLPYKRNEEIKDLLLEHEFDILQMTFVRQSVNHDYFRIMLAGKLKKDEPGETMIDEISIWDNKQQYTPEFRQLLKNYYLHL
jgi:tRNA1Val (adenine37-N6)-methyltransferase